MLGKASEIKTVFCEPVTKLVDGFWRHGKLGDSINGALAKLGDAEIISITSRIDGVDKEKHESALIIYKQGESS